MKIVQEFDVPHAPAVVWAFLDQPRLVAECVPGVEEIQELEADTFRVLVTQKVGPISATFRAKVFIAEKVEGQSMRIVSTGQVARGAAGSFRSEVTVRLMPSGPGSRLRVEGDVALAGMLGSVGQSVVERHAAGLSEAFAANLAAGLEPVTEPAPAAHASVPKTADAGSQPPPFAPAPKVAPGGVAASDPDMLRLIRQTEFWAKVAAGASVGTLAVALVLLGRLLG